MATPSLTVLSPTFGHSGGRQFVEILGQNFQLPPAPAATGKTTAPNPSVEVLFGGKAGTRVMVVSTSRLFVVTPPLDPVVVSKVFTADNGTDTLTSTAHGLKNGQRGLLQATSDDAVLPAGLPDKRYVFVVSATANTFQLATEVNGTPITFTDDGTGTLTFIAEGAVDVEVRNIDQSGVLVPGETVTAAEAYTPRRPDLLVRTDFSRVVRAMVLELRRQILDNTVVTTNTDYDKETGDTLNIAALSELPGLILFGPQLRENRFYSENEARQVASPDHGAEFFKRQRPAYTNDLVFTLVGGADTLGQILNLQNEAQLFFQRNKTLEMLRDEAAPAGETVSYEMELEPGGQPSLDSGGQPNNSNVRAFSATFAIKGFDHDDLDMAVGISRQLEDQQPGGSVQQPSAILLNPTGGDPDQLGEAFQIGPSPTNQREC